MPTWCRHIGWSRANARRRGARRFATATDLADYLVRKGVPFRDAHEVVGTLRRARDRDAA